MASIVGEKSLAFAEKVVRTYDYLCSEKKEFVMSKQFLRSGTSIGANIAEANYGFSAADFYAKMSIALKEASETMYWLILLERTDRLPADMCYELKTDCEELLRMLTAIVKKKK